MSAWTILVGNSTAPANSIAWLHLNSQTGGAGGDIFIGPILSASADMQLTAEIGEVLSADLLMDTLSANISDDTGADTLIDLEAEI